VDSHDLDVIRAGVREQLAPFLDRLTALASIQDRLDTIEAKTRPDPGPEFSPLLRVCSAGVGGVAQGRGQAAGPARRPHGAAGRSWQAATADVRGQTISSWNYRLVRYRDGRGYAAGLPWAMTEPMKRPVPIACPGPS
jgi:hypothetical protein